MENLLKTTVAATRRIASDLRPLMLDDLGLVPALEWLVQNMSQRAGIACDLLDRRSRHRAAPTHSTAVFRIVQEALTNIAKHAHASHARVGVRRKATRSRSRSTTTASASPRTSRASRSRSASSDCASAYRSCEGRLRSRARRRRHHDRRDAAARIGGGCMIRVVVADDHTILREGLRQLLGGEADIEVVAERATATRCSRGARACVRRAAARHVDARQERHRAHQAGEGREAEAARARAVDARG
jgi:hypothetical protein